MQKYKPRKNDSIIIFSNSGVNQLPIEMAKISKERGLFVVTVLSMTYAKSITSKPDKLLSYYSDIYINNHSPIGDTILEEKNTAVSSSSTIIGIFILNSLWTEMYNYLKQEKLLPFYKSSNLPNSSLHNIKLEKKFKDKNIFLK